MLNEEVDIEAYKVKIIKRCKLINLLKIDEFELVCRICATLNEKNVELIERIVHCKGYKFCQNIFNLTLELLQYGDQYSKDGIKRTPGGVFINILKKNLNKTEIKFIWNEQVRIPRN